MHLDPSLGFGVGVGPHWGIVGSNGQHGGFDPATLHCKTQKSSAPYDCVPEASGKLRYYVAPFGTVANGGDTKAYSPVELYLMGLVPASDVQPILRPTNPSVGKEGTQTYIDADGMAQTSVQDIIAKHGMRPLAAASDKAFTGAFVVFSDAPLAADKLALVDNWAAVFGNHRASTRPSFEALTGGRATMRTQLDDPLP
jgi:hypothetical protein